MSRRATPRTPARATRSTPAEDAPEVLRLARQIAALPPGTRAAVRAMVAALAASLKVGT